VKLTTEKILDDSGAVRDDRRAALKGYQKQMQKFETLFNLKAAVDIFGSCEQLTRALQKR
jgi:hypothetical protein